MIEEKIETQGDEIDLANIIKTLYDYKNIIILVTLSFIFLGVLYAFVSTKWLKTTAIVEVGHHFTNNNEQYVSDFSKFKGDVLAYGVSVFDQNESEFKDLYVDYNFTKNDK